MNRHITETTNGLTLLELISLLRCELSNNPLLANKPISITDSDYYNIGVVISVGNSTIETITDGIVNNQDFKIITVEDKKEREHK